MFGDFLFENTKIASQEKSEQELREAVIWEELMLAMTIKEEFEQFLRSDVARAMFENGIITEANSVVVLSKLDEIIIFFSTSLTWVILSEWTLKDDIIEFVKE